MKRDEVSGGKRLHRIELDLADVRQLFNSMDPSPFHEKDLDADAEEFLVGWAQEFPVHEPVSLVVHLKEAPPGWDPKAIELAVHHYFSYKADLNRLELRRLLDQGRASLGIGLAFLAGCTFLGEIAGRGTGALAGALREGLTIAGWVAMWRPMQIYLYDWWPVRRRGRIYAKMSRMRVDVVIRAGKAAA